MSKLIIYGKNKYIFGKGKDIYILHDLDALFNADYHEDQLYKNLELNENDLSAYTFENCTFESCQFDKVSFVNTIFTACTFLNSNLIMCNMKNVTLNDVKFSESKLIGINFSECNKFAFSPDYYNCILDTNIFTGNDLAKCEFNECRIKNTDFIECNLKESSFKKSNFDTVNFEHCNMEKSDFLEAKNYQINPFNNKLKNAKFNSYEALSFLSFLDIKIIE